MMTQPINLDLTGLAARRRDLDALETSRTAVRVELGARLEELERLRREGQGGAALQAAERRVADLVARRDDLSERRRQLADEVGGLADRLVAAGDEATAVTALDAQTPVAMLPVRIETRFAADQRSLAIRIYPDQIHLDAHEPELTDDEREGGQWYWQQRWPATATPRWRRRRGRPSRGGSAPGARATWPTPSARPTSRGPAPPPPRPSLTARGARLRGRARSRRPRCRSDG